MAYNLVFGDPGMLTVLLNGDRLAGRFAYLQANPGNHRSCLAFTFAGQTCDVF
jgi:hypothetical protein